MSEKIAEAERVEPSRKPILKPARKLNALKRIRGRKRSQAPPSLKT